MRSVELGSSGQQVPNMIAGMMRIGDKTDADIRGLYDSARDAVVSYFAHADLYGFNFLTVVSPLCLRCFGVSVNISSSLRDAVPLQSIN